MARRTEYVTQAEAAELCECSPDTIKRRRKDGRYPGARLGDGPSGAWELPVGDLIATGDYTPEPGDARGTCTVLADRSGAARVAELELQAAVSGEACRRLEEQVGQLVRQLEVLQSLVGRPACGCSVRGVA